MDVNPGGTEKTHPPHFLKIDHNLTYIELCFLAGFVPFSPPTFRVGFRSSYQTTFPIQSEVNAPNSKESNTIHIGVACTHLICNCVTKRLCALLQENKCHKLKLQYAKFLYMI